MTRGIFVTGTDTGVGKTLASCALLRAFAARGERALGMKPVAAGSAPGEAINADVAALCAASSCTAQLAHVNPYHFAASVAPHLAAREAGRTIELEVIAAAYRALAAQADRIVVEGAGGALVPLNDCCDMLDIARGLQLPVVLVVGVRLGCLNHACLSMLAIRARGLRCAGWIANILDPALLMLAQNLESLHELLPAPCLAMFAYQGPALDTVQASVALVREVQVDLLI